MGGRSDVRKEATSFSTCSFFCFIYKECIVEKPFKNLDEQIQILRDRGMTIIDEDFSKIVLHRHSYYDIVNGYKSYFIDESAKEEKFFDGVTLQDLFALYLFDTNLRDLTLSTIQTIEHQLRSITAYRIAVKFGANQSDYLQRENYHLGREFDKKYELDKLFAKFEKILNDEIHPFKHYKDKYNNCPPWILLKGTSFGNLIVFIRLQKKEVKEQIIADFFLREVNEIEEAEKNFFMDSLYFLLEFRNRAAHGNRIYNFKPAKRKISFVEHIHGRLSITEDMYKKGIGVNDWNAFIVFLSFIKDSSSSDFLNKLVNCLNGLHVEKQFSNDVVRKGMGLLENIIAESEK